MRIAWVLQRILPPVWLGIICATAVDAWLKFQAPGITRELGLGIGKLVFSTFNRIEWAFAIILAIAFFVSAAARITRIFFVAVLMILAAQTFWLLPNLIARIDSIVNGQTPADSSAHVFYIVLELIKIILLAVLSILSSWPAAPAKT